MSALSAATATVPTVPTAAAPTAGWRYASVVLGSAVGLASSFPILFGATLPFFLLPLSQEFGWGRGETAAAAVLGMLGVTFASPFVGRLFDRFGFERMIGLSAVLYAAGVYAMSLVPGQLAVVGALCFATGVIGCGTTMVGYSGVLPRWFDRRLGLALGISGLGGGIGVGLGPFVATRLIGDFGWRGAYERLALIALVGGIVAYLLLRRRQGEAAPFARPAPGRPAGGAPATGISLRDAARSGRFWLLLAVSFCVPFAVLGIALHGAALFLDRGLDAGQAAIGAAVGGIGALTARVGIGALLDRVAAPRVACFVFAAAALGLAINSVATGFGLLCFGVCLGGAAMGAEGDLLPFIVRRFFGMRAFGGIFGTMHSAYALGGVAGPIVYGVSFDRLGGYAPAMLGGAALCAASAVAILWMGPYRHASTTAAIR